jgi:hypothetical protein
MNRLFSGHVRFDDKWQPEQVTLVSKVDLPGRRKPHDNRTGMLMAMGTKSSQLD